jgi:hypothetical protein
MFENAQPIKMGTIVDHSVVAMLNNYDIAERLFGD